MDIPNDNARAVAAASGADGSDMRGGHPHDIAPAVESPANSYQPMYGPGGWAEGLTAEQQNAEIERRLAEDEERASWPALEPLPDGLPPVAPFELAMLPEALRPWIGDIAERMQCPPDFPAVAAMVALASVVGRQIAVRPKRRDDWTVAPNLWVCIIATDMRLPARLRRAGSVSTPEARGEVRP